MTSKDNIFGNVKMQNIEMEADFSKRFVFSILNGNEALSGLNIQFLYNRIEDILSNIEFIDEFALNLYLTKPSIGWMNNDKEDIYYEPGKYEPEMTINDLLNKLSGLKRSKLLWYFINMEVSFEAYDVNFKIFVEQFRMLCVKLSELFDNSALSIEINERKFTVSNQGTVNDIFKHIYNYLFPNHKLEDKVIEKQMDEICSP